MNESIRKFFQIGTIHFMSYPAAAGGTDPSILETLRKIVLDDYFDAVEITWIKDPDMRAEAKRMLEQSHMKVCYGAQPRLLTTGLNPNDLNEDGRKKAEDTLIEAIDEAQYMGAPGIAFFAGKWDPARKDECYKQLLKTTTNLCAYAKSRDMTVELEVFDFDIDKASLIGPAPYAARFASDMRNRCNNFGLLVDLSHLPQTYETARFAIRTMRPYITHLHIGNAVIKKGMDAYGDLHPRFGFPNSENDTPELVDFLRICREEGFFDEENPMVLSFEIKPWADENPDILIANCKRTLNRAWALV